MSSLPATETTSGETEIFQQDGVRLNVDELRRQIGIELKDYPPEYIVLIGKYIENFATKADLEKMHRLLDKKIGDTNAALEKMHRLLDKKIGDTNAALEKMHRLLDKKINDSNAAHKEDLERVRRLLEQKISDSDAARKDDIAKVNSRLDVMSGDVKNLREMFENFKQGLAKEINFAIYRAVGAAIVAAAIIAGGVASVLMLF